MRKLLLLAALCAVGAFAQDSPSQANPGDAKKGKEYWNQYTCYGCHGFSGQNGPGLRLVPMKLPAKTLIGMVRNPSQPNRMPPYSEKVLSDAQITDIWAYLKTLPDAPAAKDIPLLQQLKN